MTPIRTADGPVPVPSGGDLELWGGLECTVVRVGDRIRDQVRDTGFRERLDDLDRIAALGIRTLRFPVLWETIAPDDPRRSDWTWHDQALGRLRSLGVAPIAGLIHHGSGPRYADLLHPDFPSLFARHAERVARRYPWIDLYTPVNEPLTTARFTCLYGHWYPHRRSEHDFGRALVAECRATLLATRAIRRVNPRARFVQTDDLGRVFATPPVAYQADYENERRWLGFDLLCGRVDRDHRWWGILRDAGVSERHLREFLDGEARPDVVGINHYLTSDRFLDHRVGRYPDHLRGGNGRDVYADVEAVRVPMMPGVLGPAARLREAWERYRIPLAVTEAHHGCTRDEQLRWLHEVWRAAKALRAEGADIRAVTVWSLLGTVDWNVLLTRDAGIYEPGAFDIRGPAPRSTALAAAAASLAREGSFDHPVLDVPGWWRRPGRLYVPERARPEPRGIVPARALVVVGPDGPLRRALVRIAEARGLAVTLTGPARPLRLPPEAWAVVELLPDRFRGPGDAVARLSAAAGLRYLAFTSSAALPATAPPATETADTVSGGQAAREARIAAACPGMLLVRAGLPFGPWEGDDLIGRCLADIVAARPCAAGDRLLSFAYLPDLVHVALDLLIDGETGIRHLANPQPIPARALLADLASRAGRPLPPRGDVDPFAAVPGSLRTDRGELMPPLTSALDRYFADAPVDWRGADAPLPLAAE